MPYQHIRLLKAQPPAALFPPCFACPLNCSANMDDALAKLQEIIDKAVEAVTPKEADPETVARVKKA